MHRLSARAVQEAERTQPTSRIGPVLAAAFALFASHGASGLTLAEALRLAQERSQQLPAQAAAATASRQMAVAAGQRPDPTLKAGINNVPVDGPDRLSLTRD